MCATLDRFLLPMAVLTASCAVLAGCAYGGGDDVRSGQDGGRRDAGRLPAIDGGPIVIRDSGPIVPTPLDAAPAEPDAGLPPACASDTDCDDGLACNGVERCELGSCVAGAPPSCDDGVACTHDRCVEPASGTTPNCEHAPDDALCPSGQVCGATGCTSECSESPCRLVAPQCGCPAGQGCYLESGTRSCRPAGSAAEGASCAAPEACQPGLTCRNVARAGPPVMQCARYCGTDADCVGPGSLCVHDSGDPAVRVCTRSCDLVTNAGCSGSAVCRVGGSAARTWTDCDAPEGPGDFYASCAGHADCQRGYACISSPIFGSECLPWCRVGGFDCFLGGTCYRLDPAIVVGGIEYGVCDF